MTKMPNHPVELGKYIRNTTGRKYEWGKFDCCTWASDWSVMCGGFDVCQPFRGKYVNYPQAMQAIRDYLGESTRGVHARKLLELLCPLMAKKFGVPEIDREYIQTGDLALLRLNNPVGGALGICQNQYIFTPAHQGGLTRRQMNFVSRAWRL